MLPRESDSQRWITSGSTLDKALFFRAVLGRDGTAEMEFAA